MIVYSWILGLDVYYVKIDWSNFQLKLKVEDELRRYPEFPEDLSFIFYPMQWDIVWCLFQNSKYYCIIKLGKV